MTSENEGDMAPQPLNYHTTCEGLPTQGTWNVQLFKGHKLICPFETLQAVHPLHRVFINKVNVLDLMHDLKQTPIFEW